MLLTCISDILVGSVRGVEYLGYMFAFTAGIREECRPLVGTKDLAKVRHGFVDRQYDAAWGLEGGDDREHA